MKAFVSSGDIVEAILDVAVEAEQDLTHMGYTRRSILGGLIHGSVAVSVDQKAKYRYVVLSQ